MTTQQDKGFFGLPPSIRLRIYAFAGLATNEVIPLDRRHRVAEQLAPTWQDSYRMLNLQLADLTISSALLLVCRAIYDEVSHHFYSTNTFIAHELETLERVGPTYLSSLTSLKLIPCLTKESNPRKTCTCAPLEFIDERMTLGVVSPWDRSTLAQWKSTIKFIAPHLTGDQLDLTIICPVWNESTARRLLEPLHHLPVISNCHIRLGHLNRRNYAIQTMAMKAAKQAMGQNETTQIQPFRFFDLPTEIRLLIYQYTDLVSPLNKLNWDPKHGYTLDSSFCQPDCSAPYNPCHPSKHTSCGSPNTPRCACRHGLSDWHGGMPYCWTCTHYACQFNTCKPKPAYGTNLGLSCCGAISSAYSPKCPCWKPPIALFGTSRALREETQRVFFSKNAFEIPHYQPFSYTAEAEGAPRRCAGAVFLAEVVPADMLPHLRKLTVSLWDCVKRTSRDDWKTVISYVAGVCNLRFLSLDTALAFNEIKDAIPDTAEELSSEQGLRQIRDAIRHTAWPVEVSETAVRSLFVDVGYAPYPNCNQVCYSYRRAGDLPVLVGNERVAGDNYAFVRECEGPVEERGGGGRWLEGLHVFALEDY
ncbi:hypothetical protein BJX99DRAFT_261341 [Aspergillus californicus]